MTECIQARRTEWCQGSAVTGEGTPLKMPPCPSGLQCCSALVVSVLRSCHVIWSRWSGQGGSLSGMWIWCQTSCSSNKGCHSNDQSVSPTSDPYCYKKQREGQAGMVGRTVGSNAQYLHQLDRQDGGAHQSPLGLLCWEGGAVRALRRPSGHITGLPLITSCHIDENSVKATLTDVRYGCDSVCVSVRTPSCHARFQTFSKYHKIQSNNSR